MAQRTEHLQVSILDRLIDDESVQNIQSSLRQVKAAVARDIEKLLNSRRSLLEPPSGCKYLADSLQVYGLKDFTALNPGSGLVRQQIRSDIERTIARFESRLSEVRVQMETIGQQGSLRFRIMGKLHADPHIEKVTFDTFFDANRGTCKVSS